MFLQSGNFYSTLRLLKEDVAYLKRLSRLGVIEVPSPTCAPTPSSTPSHLDAGRKRPRTHESSVQPLPVSRSSQQSTALVLHDPATPVLGAFSWAIKEDATVIKVLGFRYAKAPILEKLSLSPSQICLASYLSRKGAAACPCPTQPGHEALDSPLHVFSDEALALRPTFEEPPYRLRGSAPLPIASTSTFRGRGGRRSQRGRSGRQLGASSAR